MKLNLYLLSICILFAMVHSIPAPQIYNKEIVEHTNIKPRQFPEQINPIESALVFLQVLPIVTVEKAVKETNELIHRTAQRMTDRINSFASTLSGNIDSITFRPTESAFNRPSTTFDPESHSQLFDNEI